MKNFIRILKHIKLYWKFAALNILFNILSIFFSLVSLTMIIPFLGLLFKPKEELVKLVENVPELTLSKDALIDNFYAYLGQIIIDSDSKINALIFICILVIITFFFKNLFRYLALYFMAPVRNGVVRDIRNEVYKKLLVLPLSYHTEERKGDIIARMTTDVQEIEFSV